MKLIRFGETGRQRPGLQLSTGERIDASALMTDYDESFFSGGGVAELERWASVDAKRAPRIGSGERLGPPIGRPSKIVCIGLNFRDHAAESGMARGSKARVRTASRHSGPGSRLSTRLRARIDSECG